MDNQLQPKGNALVMKLRQFIIDYPTSVYADDTAYILVQLWLGTPEKYLQESRVFLEKYPKASLELFTLDTLQTADLVAKEVGVIDAVKMEISQTLHYLKRYEESAKETQAVVDDLSVKTLSTVGYRILGSNYFNERL